MTLSPRNELLPGKWNFCSKTREKNEWCSKKIPFYFVTSHPVGITWTPLCHNEIKARRRWQKSDFQNEICSRVMFSEQGRPRGWRAGGLGNLVATLCIICWWEFQAKKIFPINFLILVLLLRETGGKGERWHFMWYPNCFLRIIIQPQNNNYNK